MLLILRNPHFRLFWTAGAFGDVSLIAYITVHGWLALQVTDSPFWVGATAGAGGVAMTVFAPWGGVLVDRFRKKDVVRAASALRGATAAILAALVFTDSVQLWHVIAFAVCAGTADAARIPGMKTLTMDIVGRENLLTATAARVASMTAVGVAVPLSIGPVIDGAGIGWAYLVILAGDALFLALMSLVNTPSAAGAPDTPDTNGGRLSPLDELKSGVAYTLRNPLTRTVLGAILVSELFGWSVEPMLPVIVRDVLGERAAALGMLLAAASAGAAVTALALSSVGDFRHKGWLMVGGLLAFGCSLLMFSISRSLPLSLALFALTGAATALYETAADTIMQSGVDRRMRGRVLSFQAMMWGMSGMTGFHTGLIASLIGAPFAVGAGAAIVILTGLALTRYARRLSRSDSLPLPAGR